MKASVKNLGPISTKLLALSVVLQMLPAFNLLPVFADADQASNESVRSDSADSSQTPNQARRQRIMQMLQRRSQSGGQMKEGSNPKVQNALAAIDPDKVKMQKDIRYGRDPNQDLDVYSPVASKKQLPVLIFLHGGGWSRGNKLSGHIDKGVSWAESGVVFVSINYRLAPAVTHPKQIEDVAQAFAYVYKHASEFGGDPNKIFIMGHSAGAHLVDLLGTNGKYLSEQGLNLSNIKGVISLDTASLNLGERMAEDSGEGRLVGPMIQTAFGTDPAVLADASPTLAIKTGVSYPPFLMFCGEKRVTCVAQHKKFDAAFKKVHGVVTVQEVPLSHGDISKAAGQPDSEIFKKSLAFIQGKS